MATTAIGSSAGPAGRADGATPLHLVLVGAAGGHSVKPAAERLADLLSLAVEPLPPGADQDPDAALTDLASRPGHCLMPLLRDPGQWLEPGGRWADALGAWRQPTVLVIEAERAGSGLATAYAALLEHCGVPLVGLVQWGAPWDREIRRLEGLAWLGALLGDTAPPPGSADQAEERALKQALALRCQRLELT